MFVNIERKTRNTNLRKVSINTFDIIDHALKHFRCIVMTVFLELLVQPMVIPALLHMTEGISFDAEFKCNFEVCNLHTYYMQWILRLPIMYNIPRSSIWLFPDFIVLWIMDSSYSQEELETRCLRYHSSIAFLRIVL